MDKTTTLMIRAACGVVLLIPVVFGVLWAKREAAVKECAVEALSLTVGKTVAEIIYEQGDLNPQGKAVTAVCRAGTKLL